MCNSRRVRRRHAPAVIVGRDHELALVERGVAELVAGRGGFTFVVGDAGMGKSTLARYAADRATAAGCEVLRGTGHELSQSLPYAPLVAALRRRLAEDDGAELVRGLGSLRLLFDEGIALDASAGPTEEPGLDRSRGPDDPALARARIHHALATVLTRLAAVRPLVLVSDDVHWMDASSLQVLQGLLDDLPDVAVHVLVTSRPAPSRERAEVRSLRAAVRRHPAGEDVELGPLDPPAVAALVEASLGTVPPDGLVDLVVGRTAGTPLLAVELLDALVDAGALRRSDAWWELVADDVDLPAAGELIEGRLLGLDRDARWELAVLAVAGEPTAEADLTPDGLTAPERRQVLGRLREHGLAVDEAGDDGDPRWRPSHPLLGEAATDLLSIGERRDLHARFFEAAAAAPADRRARHLLGTGPLVDPATSIDTFTEAADLALARGAVVEATRLLTAALEAGTGDRADDALDPRLVRVHERLGDVWARRGERALANDHLLRAYREHQRSGDLGAQVALIGRLEDAGWATRRWPLREELDELLDDLVRRRRWTEVVTVAHSALTTSLRRGSWGRGRELAAVLSDAAARSDDPHARLAAEDVAVLQGLWTRADQPARARDLVATLADLQRRAADAGQVEVMLRSTHTLTDFAATTGLPELMALADRSERAAIAVAGPHAAWRLTLLRLISCIEHDDPAAADELEAWLRQDPADRQRTNLLLVRCSLAVDGPTADLTDALVEASGRVAAGEIEDPVARLAVAIADLVLRGDDADAASAEQLADPDSPLFLASHGLVSLVARTLGARRLGRDDDHRAWLAYLRCLDDGEGLTSAWADVIEARTAEDPGEAARWWRAAATRFATVDRPASAARAAAAADRLDPAAAPRTAAARPRAAAPSRPDDLTGREREVADAVARGLTNREAADELFISVRTVTTHLERIYAKLGIGSRRELPAALAALDARDRGG